MKHASFNSIKPLDEDTILLTLDACPPICVRMSKVEASLMARMILQNAAVDVPDVVKTLERCAQASSHSQNPAIRHLVDDSTFHFHRGGLKAYRHCLELLGAPQPESMATARKVIEGMLF